MKKKIPKKWTASILLGLYIIVIGSLLFPINAALILLKEESYLDVRLAQIPL